MKGDAKCFFSEVIIIDVNNELLMLKRLHTFPILMATIDFVGVQSSVENNFGGFESTERAVVRVFVSQTESTVRWFLKSEH